MTSRIVLGLGNSIDYELAWSGRVLEGLARDLEVGVDELEQPVAIRSERDLVVAILQHLKRGAGTELTVSPECDLAAFARHFGYATTLGGTNVRAAIILSALGLRSTVHVVGAGDEFRKLLPPGIEWIAGDDERALEPHLVIQFAEGAETRIGPEVIRAPRANRLIVAADMLNRELPLSSEFGAQLAEAGIVLLSGLNSIVDESLLARRLDELGRLLENLPHGAVVIYEHAAFHRPELGRLVCERMAQICDIFSLNEDELQQELGRPVDLESFAEVAAVLPEFREVIDARSLVVHTSAWAAAVGDRADLLASALRGGVAVAGARYVRGDGLTLQHVREADAGPRNPQGLALAKFLRGDPGIVIVPSLDARAASPVTIGLGDAFIGGFIAGMVLGSM